MKFEDVSETEKFKSLLRDIPEEQRAATLEALRTLYDNFNLNVLPALQAALKQSTDSSVT